MLTRPLAAIAAAVVAVGGLGACRDDRDQRAEAPAVPDAAGFPTVVSGENGDVVLPAPPERIVSLSSSLADMLFAIGAGEQVVAIEVDAPATPPDVADIAAQRPDLVVIGDDADGLVAALDQRNIPALVLSEASSAEQSFAQMAILGDATGRAASADQVAATIARTFELVRLVAEVVTQSTEEPTP